MPIKHFFLHKNTATDLSLQVARLLLLIATAFSFTVRGQQVRSNRQPSARLETVKRPNILFAIADDWSPHAGAYGDKVVKTPAFDRVAREGVLFERAFVVSPSCTPSRAAVLTGQTIHRLDEGGNLWGMLPKRFPVFPDLLEAAGYHIGYTGKGWDPGALTDSGRTRNPAGPEFNKIRLVQPEAGGSNVDYVANFESFLESKPKEAPFYFWYGGHDPHRIYKRGSGLESGKKLADVMVPPFLPDTTEVRSDLLDYYAEVERFDSYLGRMLKILEDAGELDHTIVVVTGDNGMPFPRAKANLYDSGTRMPLAIRYPAGGVKGGRISRDFISFTDFAPTFLEATGLKPPKVMTGRSLLGLLRGEKVSGRDHVFVERERHAPGVRAGNLSYPARAVRTGEFLYIRNIHPERYPAGDPPHFGDIDSSAGARLSSPTKDLILARRDDPNISKYFHLATDKRPAEELYDLARDPHQLVNVADEQRYAKSKKRLRVMLDKWMRGTNDPRAREE